MSEPSAPFVADRRRCPTLVEVRKKCRRHNLTCFGIWKMCWRRHPTFIASQPNTLDSCVFSLANTYLEAKPRDIEEGRNLCLASSVAFRLGSRWMSALDTRFTISTHYLLVRNSSCCVSGSWVEQMKQHTRQRLPWFSYTCVAHYYLSIMNSGSERALLPQKHVFYIAVYSW